MARRKGPPAVPDAVFNQKLFEHDIKELIEAIQKVEAETNLNSNDVVERVGSFAIFSAAKWTDNKNLSWKKLRSRTSPKKRFLKPIVAQAKVKKYLKGGVWYERVGSDTRKKPKRKRQKQRNILRTISARNRKSKKRQDPKAPFFMPRPIPAASKRGLKKTKMMIYLKGKGKSRRKGKFAVAPVAMGNKMMGRSSKPHLTRRIINTGAGKFGWSNAQKSLRFFHGRGSDANSSSRSFPGQGKKRRRTDVKKQKASMKKGAKIRIENLIDYARAPGVNAPLGARKGTHMAKKWFVGYFSKEIRKNQRKWQKRFKAFRV